MFQSSPELNRVRWWATRSGFAIFDQGLVSGSNFVFNLLLARWLPAVSYGAFAVAFTTFLVASGLHNVLILEPMSVHGPGNYSHCLTSYFKIQVRMHVWLTAGLSALLWVGALFVYKWGSREIAVALFGMGAVIPLLLLFWLARRLAYMQQTPQTACVASGVYALVILAPITLLHHFTEFGLPTVFTTMGISSMIAAWIALRGINDQSFDCNTVTSTEVVRENWAYGCWLLASTLLYSIAFQAQTFVVAAQLGVAPVGVLRALQLPALAITQAITAISVLGLTSLSYDAGRGDNHSVHRKGLFLTLCLTGSAVCCECLLVVLDKRLELFLYRGRFAAEAWVIPALGLVSVLVAFNTSLSLGLRAFRKTKADFIANACSAPVGLISALLFVRAYGLLGAVVSLVLAAATSTIAILILYRLWGPASTQLSLAPASTTAS